ncbi:hypothetical protein Tco_1184047 [Tanacetum coccineum]
MLHTSYLQSLQLRTPILILPTFHHLRGATCFFTVHLKSTSPSTTAVPTGQRWSTAAVTEFNDGPTTADHRSNGGLPPSKAVKQWASPSGSRSLPSNTVANPRGDLKAITTRSGVALYMDLINYSNQLFSSSQEVNMKPEATKTRNVVQLPTIHSDYALPDYDAFYFDDDHIGEKSSGSTTTHSDFSLPEYDSFIFDLSIDLFPPADRSVSHHEEFIDELAHIIYPPEYDRFYFDLEIVPREFTSVLEKDLIDLLTKEFTSIKLNNTPLLLYDCDSSLSKEFSEIDLLVSFPSGNEDIVFDPEIIIEGVQFQRFKIPLKIFSTITFESDPLFFIDSPKIDTLTSFPSGNKDKVFNPGILISKGFHSRHSLGLSHQILKPSINKKIIARWRFFPSSSSIMEGISLL